MITNAARGIGCRGGPNGQAGRSRSGMAQPWPSNARWPWHGSGPAVSPARATPPRYTSRAAAPATV